MRKVLSILIVFALLSNQTAWALPIPTGNPAPVPAGTLFVKNVEYNMFGQVARVEFGNGVVTTKKYDALNMRLVRIYTVDALSRPLQDLNYTYDSVGNILTITDRVGTASRVFKYDHLNRLVSANGDFFPASAYAYDEIGNITDKENVHYTYGTRPHAVASLSDGTAIGYDANGNMAAVNKAGVLNTYVYNGENRLTAVNKNGTALASFKYDGDGGRVSKTGGGVVTRFVGGLYEVSGAQRIAHVFLGPDVAVSLIDSKPTYVHSDHLGGKHVVTDDKGAVKEIVEYKPFGAYSQHMANGVTTALGFTGKRVDADTGLYYYGERYYSPLLGRFITPDTIVQDNNPQNLNRYSYCANNPVNRVDPTGHSWFKKFFKKTVDYFYQLYFPVQYAADKGEWQQLGMRIGLTLAFGTLGVWADTWVQYAVGGALIGGTGSAISGGNFSNGMATGAVGGALAYAGGDVVVQKFTGAGIAGNIINSAGQSLMENAATGRAWNSSYTIYAGPLSINVGAGVKPTFGISSFSNLIGLGQAIKDPTAKFSLMNTISAGAPVFNGGESLHGPFGVTSGGVIYLGDLGNTDRKNFSGNIQNVFGHERFHAIIQGRMGGGNIYGTELVDMTFQGRVMQNAGTPGARMGPSEMAWKMELSAQQHDLWGGK